jgi:hypothetical protein
VKKGTVDARTVRRVMDKSASSTSSSKGQPLADMLSRMAVKLRVQSLAWPAASATTGRAHPSPPQLQEFWVSADFGYVFQPVNRSASSGALDYPAIAGKLQPSGDHLRQAVFTQDNDVFAYLERYLREHKVPNTLLPTLAQGT